MPGSSAWMTRRWPGRSGKAAGAPGVAVAPGALDADGAPADAAAARAACTRCFSSSLIRQRPVSSSASFVHSGASARRGSSCSRYTPLANTFCLKRLRAASSVCASSRETVDQSSVPAGCPSPPSNATAASKRRLLVGVLIAIGTLTAKRDASRTCTVLAVAGSPTLPVSADGATPKPSTLPADGVTRLPAASAANGFAASPNAVKSATSPPSATWSGSSTSSTQRPFGAASAAAPAVLVFVKAASAGVVRPRSTIASPAPAAVSEPPGPTLMRSAASASREGTASAPSMASAPLPTATCSVVVDAAGMPASACDNAAASMPAPAPPITRPAGESLLSTNARPAVKVGCPLASATSGSALCVISETVSLARSDQPPASATVGALLAAAPPSTVRLPAVASTLDTLPVALKPTPGAPAPLPAIATRAPLSTLPPSSDTPRPPLDATPSMASAPPVVIVVSSRLSSEPLMPAPCACNVIGPWPVTSALSTRSAPLATSVVGRFATDGACSSTDSISIAGAPPAAPAAPESPRSVTAVASRPSSVSPLVPAGTARMCGRDGAKVTASPSRRRPACPFAIPSSVIAAPMAVSTVGAPPPAACPPSTTRPWPPKRFSPRTRSSEPAPAAGSDTSSAVPLATCRPLAKAFKPALRPSSVSCWVATSVLSRSAMPVCWSARPASRIRAARSVLPKTSTPSLPWRLAPPPRMAPLPASSRLVAMMSAGPKAVTSACSIHGPTAEAPNCGDVTLCTAPKRMSPPPVVIIVLSSHMPCGVRPLVAKSTEKPLPAPVIVVSNRLTRAPPKDSAPLPPCSAACPMRTPRPPMKLVGPARGKASDTSKRSIDGPLPMPPAGAAASKVARVAAARSNRGPTGVCALKIPRPVPVTECPSRSNVALATLTLAPGALAQAVTRTPSPLPPRPTIVKLAPVPAAAFSARRALSSTATPW